MQTWIRKTTVVAAIAAGALLALPAAANAAPAANCHRVHQQSGNGFGLLNNNNIYLPVDLGLGITGNALGILGVGSASGTTTTTVDCGN